MSFGNLSWAWSLFGVAAIAAILFVLQRLRVRHTLVEVETTLFWQQAIEESRARVRVQRFRHPWAYVLILLISLLLWLSVAGIRINAGEPHEHLVLLDGSAAMSVGNRFSDAVDLACEYANSLPEESRTVVLCSGDVQTLLRPGEDPLLLTRRLQDLRPSASPNSISYVLQQYAVEFGSRPTSVCIVGDHSLSASEVELLPESVQVRQIKVAQPAVANIGITCLGVRAASSGQWSNVDVLVEVLGDAVPSLAIDGQRAASSPVVEALPGGARYRFSDVTAGGGLLTAGLSTGDAMSFDDRAQFVLPDRRQIAVAVEPGIAEVVRQVIAADPGLLLQDAVDAQTQIAVRSVGSTFGAGIPTMEFSTAEQADDAFLICHPSEQDPVAVLDDLYRGLGLSEIDAMAASSALGRPMTVGTRPSERKQLWVWQELLQPEYDFVSSRSFPLFVGLGLRWLASFEDGPVRVAVGEPLILEDEAVTVGGTVSRSFSDVFVPTVAGLHVGAQDTQFAASLLDREASGQVSATRATLEAATATVAGRYDLITIILAIALLLLGVEWLLFRTARIP